MGLTCEPSISAERRHAVDFLIETCRSAGPDGLTLCTIGPMTNIATALVMAPDIGANIAEIAFMGGAALGPGNITPAAEFNIFVDPHAARVVLESGVRTTMFGLEVTHKALATPARRAAIDALDTRSSRAASQILAYYDSTDVEKYGDAGAPLHDPLRHRLSFGARIVRRPELSHDGFNGRRAGTWADSRRLVGTLGSAAELPRYHGNRCERVLRPPNGAPWAGVTADTLKPFNHDILMWSEIRSGELSNGTTGDQL